MQSPPSAKRLLRTLVAEASGDPDNVAQEVGDRYCQLMSALGGKQTLASGDSQVLNPYGTPANLVDSSLMTPIIFRDLPAVAAVELQLDMRFRDRLLDDEIEELPHLIDDASIELFGITQRETFYWALPEPVRQRYGRIEWEENFDVLGHYTRDPNAHWRIFDLDLRCEKGSPLHCLEVFGRQLVCALQGLHPRAELTFAHTKTVQAG